MIAHSLYPFEGKTFRRSGIGLHYLDEGSGAPVVMVHGNPSWSIYFRGLVQGLRGSHRVIVPDHIGMGLSDKPGDDRYRYTLESRVDDLDALLEHLGVRKDVTLVVHDWGGMIGTAWACRRPERVRRMVILNTAAFFPPPSKPLPASLKLSRGPLGALLVRGCNAFALGAAYFCTTKPMSQELRAAYLYPYSNWGDRRAVHRFVQDIPVSSEDPAYALVKSTQESLGKLKGVPKLLCWGGKDFVFDADFLAEWRRRCPEAEVHEFPEAGHYILEDAGTEVLALIEGFLARHPL